MCAKNSDSIRFQPVDVSVSRWHESAALRASALRVIGDHGGASAVQVLNAMTSTDADPAILAAANAALAQITARQPVK